MNETDKEFFTELMDKLCDFENNVDGILESLNNRTLDNYLSEFKECGMVTLFEEDIPLDFKMLKEENLLQFETISGLVEITPLVPIEKIEEALNALRKIKRL
jgi:hypothetical protein